MGKLYRSSDKKIAGVAAGLAECHDLDVRAVRIVWLILTFFAVGAPILCYLILWAVLPERDNKKDYEERMNERLGK